MRLDKFLKVSRVIKRRTLAKEVADKGRVLVNGSKAKAGTNIKKGDVLDIQFGQKLVTIEIMDVKDVVKKEDAQTLYKIVKETKQTTSN